MVVCHRRRIPILEEIRREAPDLAVIIEKVRETLPKVGDRTPVSTLRSIGSKGGLTGRRRSSSVSSATRSAVKKETLCCPPCDADNPIVISDGEEETEARKTRETRVSQRDKESRLQSDERSSPLSNENHSSNSGARATEAGKSAKEVESVVPSLRNSDCTAGLSTIISREDLYYNEADRAELASWAEFPREAELSRRHELVVRTRQREELRQGQSSVFWCVIWAEVVLEVGCRAELENSVEERGPKVQKAVTERWQVLQEGEGVAESF